GSPRSRRSISTFAKAIRAAEPLRVSSSTGSATLLQALRLWRPSWSEPQGTRGSHLHAPAASSRTGATETRSPLPCAPSRGRQRSRMTRTHGLACGFAVAPRRPEEVGTERCLPVLTEVQANALLLLGHTEWNNHIGDLKQHERAEEGEAGHDDQGQQMIEER